jgi:hypothetical protein
LIIDEDQYQREMDKEKTSDTAGDKSAASAIVEGDAVNIWDF